MKITIDENTKELIIEGTYTIAQLKEYLNLSGSLMDFTIITILEPVKSSCVIIKGGIVTDIGNPPTSKGAQIQEFNNATGKKASEVGAKVHEQIENYIKNTNDTL